MSPKKLSDSDQKEIVELYRTSPETTATLAQKFGVSSSTVSRLLKSSLNEAEYESLIQQKRITSRKSGKSNLTTVKTETTEQPQQLNLEALEAETTEKHSDRRIPEIPEEDDQDLVDMIILNEILGEDIDTLEDDYEDDEEDDDDNDDWGVTQDDLNAPVFRHQESLEILPLSEACFPKICYVVIDRFGDLITKPLQEFADLGEIPSEEVQQKTLPIFDNQKIARRFSNRSQKVIKVPDGKLFQKTCTYLKAKGITRLLVDGQVYAW